MKDGRWVIEVNRHGHYDSPEGWKYFSGAKNEADADYRLKRLALLHENAKWLPGRKPSVPFEYRKRWDTTPLEPLNIFAR